MSKSLELITKQINLSATDDEILSCLEELVDESFKHKLSYYIDEIDNYELKDFFYKVISECYWGENDDYYAYDCTITEVYGTLVITVAYVL